MTVVFWIVGVWGVLFITWALYICAMQLKHHKDELYPIAKVHAYILAAAMLAFDFVVNLIASLFLLELPRWDLGEFLLSPRLKRIRKDYAGTWRGTVATWICEHWLNQFDRSGDHC